MTNSNTEGTVAESSVAAEVAAQPTSRKRQKEETRSKILEAAIHCFSARGFDGAHFSDITRECGVKHPTVLYHFESKENLWREAVLEVVRRFEKHFVEQLCITDDMDDEARLRNMLNAFIEALVAVPQYGKIYLREGGIENERLEWLVKQLYPAAVVEASYSDPHIRNRLFKTIVRDILGVVLISITSLGPMLDASLAHALETERAGIYPLSDRRKQELVDALVAMVLRAA